MSRYVAEQIELFVREYIETRLNVLKYDKTLMGKVISISGATSVVEINGENLNCRIKDGITIAVGDVVIIKVPNNNKDRKYIDGKLKK